jgi:hypothetical protein
VSRARAADEEELTRFVREVVLQDEDVIGINEARMAAIRKQPAYRGTKEALFRMWLEGLWKFWTRHRVKDHRSRAVKIPDTHPTPANNEVNVLPSIRQLFHKIDLDDNVNDPSLAFRSSPSPLQSPSKKQRTGALDPLMETLLDAMWKSGKLTVDGMREYLAKREGRDLGSNESNS